MCGAFDGERGIRTLGDISATFDFESSALDQLSHLSVGKHHKALRATLCGRSVALSSHFR